METAVKWVPGWLHLRREKRGGSCSGGGGAATLRGPFHAGPAMQQAAGGSRALSAQWRQLAPPSGGLSAPTPTHLAHACDGYFCPTVVKRYLQPSHCHHRLVACGCGACVWGVGGGGQESG